MATVRERRPGVWQVRVFTGRGDDGKPTQVARTVYGTKRDALREAARLEAVPQRSAGGRTVADALHAWLEHTEASHRPSSHRDQEGRVRLMESDPIAQMPLARLGVAEVDAWVIRMRRSGVGASAAHNRFVVLRAALQQAVVWGWVASNPASLARAPKVSRPARDSMTADDVIAVIDAAAKLDPLAGLALRIAAVAGARRAEIAALRWADLEGSVLTVDSAVMTVRSRGRTTLVDGRTKTGERHRVTLDRETVALWQKLRRVHEEFGPYVCDVGAGPPNPDRVGWWWQRARAASGIAKRWRLHDLRHFSATAAIGQGHDVRTVAQRLGHANPAMTLRVYAHALQTADEAVAESLGRALNPPRPRRADGKVGAAGRPAPDAG